MTQREKVMTEGEPQLIKHVLVTPEKLKKQRIEALATIQSNTRSEIEAKYKESN